MRTNFEKLGITYRQEGDYLLPNIEVPESPQISIWGQRRLQYLRTNKKVLYTTMLMGGTLKDHLEEMDQSANDMYEQLILQTKEQESITEELKANNQMEWVQKMNNIRNRAAEVVYKELIHGMIYFRNKLIQQGRYPDAIDELLIKLQKARRYRYG